MSGGWWTDDDGMDVSLVETLLFVVLMVLIGVCLYLAATAQ